MLKAIVTLLTVCAISSPLLAAKSKDKAAAAKSENIRVLIITGGHSFEREPFLKVFDQPGLKYKEVKHPEAVQWFAPDKAGEYDVMVWYDCIRTPLSEADKANLVALLKKGKGLVALHHCLINYPDWPEGQKIIGGRWWEDPKSGQKKGTFKHGVKLAVTPVADHPITRSLKPFEIDDEAYNNYEIEPGVKPMLTTDNPDSEKVIGWTHTYGASPVAYIQLGHGPEAYANPAFVKLVGSAIRWAAAQVPAASETKPASKEPVWKLGTQAYTFRLYTFFEAIDKAKGLGLKYIEAYPGQALSPEKRDVKWDHNASPEVRQMVRDKLKKDGLTLINYGVVDLGKTEESMRKVFDFAKDMGIETIVAEPAPGTFDLLDKLTEEYKINVAIHNHPTPSHYWNPQTVLDAIKGHSKRIGACADIGHWVRSGVDPVEGVKQLKGHIISMHFKDLNEKSRKAHDVPWGTGVCNVKGVMAELHKQGFSGEFSVEYEHNWDKSVPEIAEGLKYFKEVAKELGQKVE